MSTNYATADKTDDGPYSYHREPPSQGANLYVRCNSCGRECIPADPERLDHKRDCPEASR